MRLLDKNGPQYEEKNAPFILFIGGADRERKSHLEAPYKGTLNFSSIDSEKMITGTKLHSTKVKPRPEGHKWQEKQAWRYRQVLKGNKEQKECRVPCRQN